MITDTTANILSMSTYDYKFISVKFLYLHIHTCVVSVPDVGGWGGLWKGGWGILFSGYTSGEDYIPCIYSPTRWELPQAFVVRRLSSGNYLPGLVVVRRRSGPHSVSKCDN